MEEGTGKEAIEEASQRCSGLELQASGSAKEQAFEKAGTLQVAWGKVNLEEHRSPTKLY